MVPYGLVLSDELQEVYLDFKEKKDFDQDIVQRLFQYFKGLFITNTAQMKRIGRELTPEVEQQLRGAGYTTQSLEDLAKKTVYKIILTTDNNTFPHVNIHGDAIENNLSGCFMRGDRREKAISHIKALCDKAKEVFIYDKYITSGGSERRNQENLNCLASLFPRKHLRIVHRDGHLKEADINFLMGICNKWTFEKKMDLPDHHDRYLIVDNKMEIVLTSGFSSLTDTTKEFIYIVRPVTQSRFERR